jgi:hypothetical protein
MACRMLHGLFHHDHVSDSFTAAACGCICPGLVALGCSLILIAVLLDSYVPPLVSRRGNVGYDVVTGTAHQRYISSPTVNRY